MKSNSLQLEPDKYSTVSRYPYLQMRFILPYCHKHCTFEQVLQR